MAILLPHIENSDSTYYIPPREEYELFQDDDHYAVKVREWGLSTTKEVKRDFWYKDKTYQRQVIIKGYQTFGKTVEYNTLVIEFQDGNLSCIHPAYLKEMQSSSFGKELKDSDVTDLSKEIAAQSESQTETAPTELKETTVKKEPKQPKVKKEKPAKLVLPEEKVRFTGKVKQFAMSWNHFNEENDEVVVLENVRIENEEPIDVGLAWCAHSKTLKKFELSTGEILEFYGKIVKKSLPKGKDVEEEELRLEVSVTYKINNPSKIQKK